MGPLPSFYLLFTLAPFLLLHAGKSCPLGSDSIGELGALPLAVVGQK